MVSLARKNLFEDLPRFLVAQAGIMFAVTLVTIQTGILNGFTRSTGLLIDYSPADIWVGSDEMVNLELTKPILFEQVNQARRVPGVERAEALMLAPAFWNSPQGELTPLKLFAFDPAGELFVPGEIIQGAIAELNQPLTMMLDVNNLKSLNLEKKGDSGQIRSLPARLVAITQDTQSIASSAFVFTSLENAKLYVQSGLSSQVNCKLVEGDIQCNTVVEQSPEEENSSSSDLPVLEPLTATDPITYVLIKAQPGTNLKQLKRNLEVALPGTQAYTKKEIAEKTRDYWQQRTGVGFILGLGATVGVIVGTVIVGQILYTSVSDHIKEFGTLKAMGASNWIIYGAILEQAFWMAILGYIPGMLLCYGLSSWTLATQGITILITPVTAVGVLGVTILMCTGSAVFAIQKVTRVDPGIVFKA